MKIKKQISLLYASSILGNLSLTGAWVAILASRGYSLVEIGFVETVFHITSLMFEIPSGVLADVFGRKNMLIVSSIMRMIGNVVMICSSNLFMVCASIAFHAVSYNFSSGSGEALAYDSLKMAGREEHYERYISNQMVLYRLCSGISTMCAGFALLIGYKVAYGTDILMGILQIGTLLSLYEERICRREVGSVKMLHAIWREIVSCFTESILFLRQYKKAVCFMLCNSLVGAVDILLLFFLQARLPEEGMSNLKLGFALFFMEMGGILGARVIHKCKRMRYRTLFAVTLLLVLMGVLAEHTGLPVVMMIGGFTASFSDDALQVRTNTILQDMILSKQRATLISIDSFIFSVIMIVLSPLAGILYS